MIKHHDVFTKYVHKPVFKLSIKYISLQPQKSRIKAFCPTKSCPEIEYNQTFVSLLLLHHHYVVRTSTQPVCPSFIMPSIFSSFSSNYSYCCSEIRDKKSSSCCCYVINQASSLHQSSQHISSCYRSVH